MDRYTKGFVVASLVYFVAAAVLGVWMGGAETAGWVRFAHVHFNLLGFMAMMIYGVGYFILPRFNARTLRWPSWVPVHFYLSNVGLVGMVAVSETRPSAAFVVFALLSLAGAVLFVTNLVVTILAAPREQEDAEEEPARPAPAPAAAAPPAEGGGAPRQAPAPGGAGIHADMRVGEILTRWPETVEVFVARGFASLADPGHREQVKQIPITLRMACQRHNVDLEAMVARLNAVASGALSGAGSLAAAAPGEGVERKGNVVRGQPIKSDDILGDIIAVYPKTTEVFRKYYGEGCFSCPGQATESVKQSALMHNVDTKKLLAELNRAAGF